jgi:hypothetical protein
MLLAMPSPAKDSNNEGKLANIFFMEVFWAIQPYLSIPLWYQITDIVENPR